jgi:hypothetical protein
MLEKVSNPFKDSVTTHLSTDFCREPPGYQTLMRLWMLEGIKREHQKALR